MRRSLRGSTRGRGQTNTSQIPSNAPTNAASNSPPVSHHTELTLSQPLPEIQSSPIAGQKRGSDQPATTEEPSTKRGRLTNTEDELDRATTSFESADPAEMAGVYPKNKKLISFFQDFNKNHPLPTQDDIHLSQMVVDIVLAPWKAADGRPSLVEERQNRAEVGYKQVVIKLKGSENGMQEYLEFIYGYETILVNSLKRFLDDLEHQPVFEALQDVKNAIMLLLEQGDTITSRFLAKSLAHRLNRKPLLQFDFDLDRDLPRLKELMARADERLDFIPL